VIPTAEEQLYRKLNRRFQQAIRDYQLIADGDRILVGLSGGKDSLFLLEMLAKRSKIDRPKFHLEAVHIRMTNISYESDTAYLEDFANSHGVKLNILETSFDASTDHRKSPCFLCSWNRRKQLFQYAQQQGCNKIALGHHRDDILHTALLNLLFQGQFSTMPVKIEMRKMPITIIRPLATEEEADIRQYAEHRGYRKQTKICPYDTATHRDAVRKLFEKIEEISPNARHSLWNALEAEEKLIETAE